MEKRERRNQKTKSVGNGEGSLYYSEKLKIYVYQYTEKTTGKRKTIKQRKGEGNTEFKKRVTALKASMDNGTYIAKSKDTGLKIIENFVKQKYNDGIVGARTYSRDLETIEQIKKTCSNWINLPIQKVTAEHIEVSKSEIREYSNNTIDKIWRFINTIFKIAVSRRKIMYNPMLDETLNKPVSKKKDKIIEAFTKKEEKNIIKYFNEHIEHPYAPVVLLQLYTGMRIGEVLALSKDCIDLKNNTIHIYRSLTRDLNDKVILGEHTKTYNRKTGIDKGERTIPIPKDVKPILQNLLSSKITNINNLLFWDYGKNRLVTDGMVNSYLDRVNAQEKIVNNFSTHRLRHTFVTRCQEKGMPLVVIQSLVGHVEGSSITNNVYTTVSLEFMKQEMDKIAK